MDQIGIKKAVMLNAASKYGTMFVQLGLTAVLSRVIVPEAFGVVAIVTVLIGFLSLFTDLGLGINIIQHPDMSKESIAKLFSFSAFVGLFLACFMALLAFPIAALYENEIYYIICPLIAIVPFFNSLNVVPNAILTRDKRFDIIALRSIFSAVFSGLIAVVLAFLGMSVYALVLQAIISSIFVFLWNYYQYPLNLSPFRIKDISSLLGTYSLYQVFFNLLNYFTRNLDQLVIGRTFGSADLAYYNKSYALYLYPNNIFAAVITGVLHPYIREYKDDYTQMYAKYEQIIRLLSVIGVLTMVTFFYCSEEIILIMFGRNWYPAITCLRCLSLCMWTQMMCSVAGSVFLGLERTDQTFKCGLINVFLIISAIVIGVFFKNIVLLSFCVAMVYNIIFITTNYILVKKTLNFSLLRFFRSFISDGILAYIFMSIACFLPLPNLSLWLSLLVKLGIISLFYICYLALSGYTSQMKTLLSLFTNIK